MYFINNLLCYFFYDHNNCTVQQKKLKLSKEPESKKACYSTYNNSATSPTSPTYRMKNFNQLNSILSLDHHTNKYIFLSAWPRLHK